MTNLNPWISAAARTPKTQATDASRNETQDVGSAAAKAPPQPPAADTDADPSLSPQKAVAKEQYAELFMKARANPDEANGPQKGEDSPDAKDDSGFAARFAAARAKLIGSADQEESYNTEIIALRSLLQKEEKESATRKRRESDRSSTTATPVDAPESAEDTDPEERPLLNLLKQLRSTYSPGELPPLINRTEKQIRANVRELSLIEGNLVRMNRSLRSIYCTSCFDGEGKTTTAIHTAFGLAEFANREVLLIDTDNANPQLHYFFDVANEQGLQEILSGEESMHDVILPTAYDSLYLLPAGNGQISLLSDQFESFMQTVSQNFDYVIIDGRSTMVASSPSNVATSVDAFLIVVECESTKWEVVQMADNKLKMAGAKATAVVLNKRKFYLPKTVYKFMSKKRK